jgi:hypothetical protein
LLGQALLEKHDWKAAVAVYAGARAAFLLLFGQGLNEADARDLIGGAGPVFSEAAYAAVERDELDAALSLLSEGKARLMSVTLRQQNIDLPPDKRARYAAIRAEIREWLPRVESAKGTDAMLALERLTALRRELGELIETALAKEAAGGGAMAAAAVLLAQSGAIAAPIVTKVGGKLLLVIRGKDRPAVSVIDLPLLTSERLEKPMRGDGTVGKSGGWLGAYEISLRSAPLTCCRDPFGKVCGHVLSAGSSLRAASSAAICSSVSSVFCQRSIRRENSAAACCSARAGLPFCAKARLAGASIPKTNTIPRIVRGTEPRSDVISTVTSTNGGCANPEHEIATAIARCAEERAWRRCDYFETADIAAGSAFLMC